LEQAIKNVLTTDRKSTILQILIPNITLYLVLLRRYRTCQKNVPTFKNIKLWMGGTPSKQQVIKKIFLNFFIVA